jgi:hypothetical protein
MSLSTSRKHGRLAAILAVAAYAFGVGVLPTLHAAGEVARSQGSIEASHTDACPTLHAGTVCAAAAGLGTGHIGSSPVTHTGAGLVRDDGHPTITRLDSTSLRTAHAARAPPHG